MKRGFLCALAALAWPAGADAQTARALLDLSLEELVNVRVTSVSRRAEPLSEAAASVYVITAEDIRRAGVTSLPGALNLAPNLLVARVNATEYAVTTSRGFLSTLNNKLLVMIDGRSIYTPLFSGVQWDAHDVMLEDVERIEVISGPAGTTWGTNAVNGVINVVTRSAAATQGLLASAYAGNRGEGLAARYGASLGATAARLYAKRTDRDALARVDGAALRNGGARRQAGFRSDWREGRDGLTVQGDAYESDLQEAAGPRSLSGLNLLGRWTRALEGGAAASVQAYFDRSERNHAGNFAETLDIVDIETHYSAAPVGAHRLVLGGGYRHADDRTRNAALFAFVPGDRRLDWLNVFVEDEIALAPGLKLAAGVRAEHNTYTGWETLPSLRLAWQPAVGRLVWGSVSRGVRSPSRVDRDLFVPAAPPFTTVAGGPGFVSETSDVLQAGYRAQVSARLAYSVTAFVHRLDDIRSVEPSPGGPMIENRIEGRTRGVEGWGTLQLTPAWRLRGGLFLLDQDLVNEPGSASNPLAEANDPSHRWTLRSSHDLGGRVGLDVGLRRVGALPGPQVAAYTALDARLAWRAARALEVSLVGQNLNGGHPEFGAAATRAEVPRAVYLHVRLELP